MPPRPQRAARLGPEGEVERDLAVQLLLDADLLQDLGRVARRHRPDGRLRVLPARRRGGEQAEGEKQESDDVDTTTGPAAPPPTFVRKACEPQNSLTPLRTSEPDSELSP